MIKLRHLLALAVFTVLLASFVAYGQLNCSGGFWACTAPATVTVTPTTAFNLGSGTDGAAFFNARGTTGGGSGFDVREAAVLKGAFQYASPDTYIDFSGSLHVRDGAGSGTERLTLLNGLLIGAATGGDKGAGTLNLEGALYANNQIIASSTGGLTGLTFATVTNCASSSGVCTAAPSGSFSMAAAATTAGVATTAVSANSQIFIQEDSTLGSRLSVTCNTTVARSYAVTTRTAATSFVITASAAPVANPACFNFWVIN